MVLGLFLTGCDETNDFINPGEPQIVDKDAPPKVAPILDTLDRSIEAPDSAYSQAEDVRPDDLIPDVSDYQIGKNDLVNITILDLMGEGTGETTKTVRVSETGMVSLPFISPVKAEDLTEHQLEDAITKAYEDAKLIKNARVTVQVAEARQRTFSVQGNVGAWGEYQITRPDFRMLDAMVTSHFPAVALGVDYAYVIRKVKSEEPTPPPAPETTTPETPETPQTPSTPPATAPGDLLTPPSPQSQLDTPIQGRPLQMDSSTESSGGSSSGGSNNGGLLAPGADEGASGVIEGKPAPSGNENPPPTVEPTSPTAPVEQNPAEQTPMPPPAPMQEQVPPAVEPTPGTFEFNAPKEPNDVRVIRVPIRLLREQGELKYNIVIRPGDMIWVPDPVTGIYYVGGHITRPGVFSLTGIPVTIKQAWIAGGGADDFAIPKRSELIRRLGPNKEVVVRIDLAKIWKFEQPDIYLKPNDSLYVGTNAPASFIAAVRNSFRFSTGMGFLYDQNFGPTGNTGF
jgi:protein involved in polysaccharide export with SLBB domain